MKPHSTINGSRPSCGDCCACICVQHRRNGKAQPEVAGDEHDFGDEARFAAIAADREALVHRQVSEARVGHGHKETDQDVLRRQQRNDRDGGGDHLPGAGESVGDQPGGRYHDMALIQPRLGGKRYQPAGRHPGDPHTLGIRIALPGSCRRRTRLPPDDDTDPGHEQQEQQVSGLHRHRRGRGQKSVAQSRHHRSVSAAGCME